MATKLPDAENGFRALGDTTEYPNDYDPGLLETFANRHPDRDYWVLLECFEFTSLCPVTGQPDWATLLIRYLPEKKMVESKSLKLYLNSFRNRGDFHEDVVNIILNDLRDLLSPRYIEVFGIFHPRGGIAIHPFANWGSDRSRLDAEKETYAGFAVRRRDGITLTESLQSGKHFR